MLIIIHRQNTTFTYIYKQHFETELQIQLYFYISVKTVIRGKIAEDTGTCICVEEFIKFTTVLNVHI
jgi:hypothetical protein